MIIPMQAGLMQDRPPSPYALNCRWVILTVLILQTISDVLRFVLVEDIMGGCIMLIIIGFGWYAYTHDFSLSFFIYWGVLAFINGLLDVVQVTEYALYSSTPLFSSSESVWYNAASVVQILCPITELAGSVIAWLLYKNREDPEQMPLAAEDRGPRFVQERRNPPQVSQEGYEAFRGTGQRLDP